MVTWEQREDSQFPSIMLDLLEVAKYASLWVTKDAQRIKDNKIFWILMEMNIYMAINRKPQLLPTVFANLQGYVEFKEYFHHVSISVLKDPKKTWYEFPYLETNDAIDAVLDY